VTRLRRGREKKTPTEKLAHRFETQGQGRNAVGGKIIKTTAVTREIKKKKRGGGRKGNMRGRWKWQQIAELQVLIEYIAHLLCQGVGGGGNRPSPKKGGREEKGSTENPGRVLQGDKGCPFWDRK